MPSATYNPETKYKTRLSRSCSATDDILYLDALPAESSGLLMIEKNSDTNFEIVFYGAKSGAGTTGDPYKVTGVVRGLASTGSSLTAGTGKRHGRVEVGSADVHYFISLIKAHLDGVQIMPSVASTATLPTTGNTQYDIRFVKNQTAFYYWTLVASSGTTNDWVALDQTVTAYLSKVSGTDDTPAHLESKLIAGTNMSIVKTGSPGNETLVFNSTVVTDSIEAHATYTPAYLVGGASAESNVAIWDSVTNGSFRATIDGTARNFDAINFTGVTTMAEVASTIQTKIRAVTGSTETCVWSTDHFIITSANTTSSSQVSVLTTSTGTVGTDISGAGASTYMDSETGRGTAFPPLINPAADEGRVPEFDEFGKLNNTLTGVFGGTGADGALNVASGTTTINLAGEQLVVKNYSSIYIASGATLAFSNPHANGTIIVLKSTSFVSIKGTIDASGIGAAGGTGGDGANSAVRPGTDGSIGTNVTDTDPAGNLGGGGDTGVGPGAAGGTAAIMTTTPQTHTALKLIRKVVDIYCGNGGGGGGAGYSAAGGALGGDGGNGGRGGAGLYIECKLHWDFTGTINVSGLAGSPGVVGSGSSYGSGGGGGGGSAGSLLALYNLLTANTGTVLAAGGAGGAGANGAGAVAYGGGGGGSGGASHAATGRAGGAGASSAGAAGAGTAGGAASGGGGGGGGASTVNQTGAAAGASGASDSEHYFIAQNTVF